MEIENIENILARRKEIEGELMEMLKETKSDFTLDHVREAIYNEEDNDDMIHPVGYGKLSNGVKIVATFDGSTSLTTGRGGDASELTPLDTANNLTGLSTVLELVTDAWNYPSSRSFQLRYGACFSHKVLGGISPAEKILEHHKNPHK